MSRQTQSYDDKAIRGEELESLATSIAQKIVDNGQVVADALDELDARTRALENRNPDVLGDAVADSLDTQVLKIGGQPIDTSAFEQVSNKVSAWQTTPDNTHYPSEKLVKDGLDAKADANKVVAIADAQIVRSTATSDNWLKAISHTHMSANTNIIGVWKISFVEEAASHIAYEATLIVNIRCNGSGQQPTIYNAFLKTESSYSLYSVCVEAIGVAGNVVANVYFNVPSYGAITIKCLSNGARDLSLNKNFWTYTSYGASATGVAKPVTDESTNTKVQDALVSKVQYNIASPTNNNLVAMDANGLVKDSGLTKSSVESAISSAGSAIQGVKVNNNTLTPDANKVVTVPLATTSADGAMSAADKTKLNNAATYTQSSGTAPVKVDAYGALTPVPMDSTPTASSTNLVTSGGVKTALDGKQNTLPTTGTPSDTYAINVSGKAYQLRSIEVRSPENDKYWAKIAETTRNNQSDYSITFNVQLDGYSIIAANLGILSVALAQNGSGVNMKNAVFFFRTDAREFDNIKAVVVNTGTVLELWVCNKRTSQYVYFTPLNTVRFNPVYGKDRQYTQAEFESYLKGKTSFNSVEKGVNRSGSNAVGSSSVPVWVDANGTLTACTDDFEHTTNKVTSVRAASSATDTAYPSEKAVRSALNSATSSSFKYLGILTSGDLNEIRDVGFYSLAGSFTNLPSDAPSNPIYGTLQNFFADGSEVARTQILYLRSDATRENMWVRHYVNLPQWSSWRRVLRADNVTSTYSSTGTAPVNGTAVASAISGKQDTLSFMTTAEATSLWQSAWAAAN